MCEIPAVILGLALLWIPVRALKRREEGVVGAGCGRWRRPEAGCNEDGRCRCCRLGQYVEGLGAEYSPVQCAGGASGSIYEG